MALASLWIAGCGGGDSSGSTGPPPPAPRVSSVVVTPNTGTLLASGATLQFNAAATNNDGSAAGGASFTWTSSDTEIATVSTSGLATASGALGRAVISATTSGITGTATLDVAAGPEGGTFTAFDNTVTLVVPPSAVAAPVMVTITPIVTPPTESGLLAGAVYEFLPEGTTFNPPATLVLAFDPTALPPGLPETELTLLTESEDGVWEELEGATVDSALNTVTALIIGFSGKGAGSRASTIELVPSSAVLEVGEATELQPTLRNSLGEVLHARRVRWSSDNESVARVESNVGTGLATGFVTGVNPGIATLTAASGQASATVVVTVTEPELRIVTTSLPDGMQGVAYSHTLEAVGGDGNYTWAVTVGTLPAGLAVNPATGEISGTPTESGSTFTVQVAGGDGQTAAQQLTINVIVPLVLNSSDLCSDHSPADIATFEDANLEAAVRNALALGVLDDLTCALLTGLTRLTATGSGIASLVGIQNLTSLTYLALTNNSIVDISVVSGLTSLQELYLDTNSITDIVPLGGLTALTHLSLIRNPVAVINVLSGLTTLTWLGLTDTSITDIGPLSGLTSLETVIFQRTAIVDINALSGLTSLTTLIIPNNSIGNISAVSGLTSLTVLWIGGNSITDFSPLGGLTNLTTLEAQNSGITDISMLSGLTNLQQLILGLNSISDISALSGLTALISLTLHNNPLAIIQALLDNTGLGTGDSVDLRSTNVSCTDVAALQAKGVTVTSDCGAEVSVTTTSLPDGALGTAYSQTLAATGGNGNYTWAMFNGTTLPAGLTLNTTTGLISGTPTAAGTTNFEVEVTSGGQTATKALSITVNASWQIVFEDNFNGNTLDAGNWTQDEVTPPRPYSLTGSGQLRIGGGEGDGPSLFYNTAISGNYVRVTTEFRTDVDDAIQDDVDMLMFLNVDPTGANGYALLLTSDPVGATRDYELIIIRLANNVPTVLAQASMGGTMPQIGPNTDYVLEGSNSNGTITFTVKDANGIVLKSLSILDSSYSGGRIGIGGDLNVDAASPKSIFFDYVRVEKFQ